MKQRSFIFVKPDGVKRHLIGEIIKRFEEGGLQIEALEMVEPHPDIVNKHYPLNDREYLLTLGHVDTTNMSEEELERLYQKNYKVVERLHKYITSGPIVKMIISGDDVVARVRSIVGKTNPAASPKGTIRGDLGTDSFDVSDAEGRACENLVHASGNPEEAEREIKLWFDQG